MSSESHENIPSAENDRTCYICGVAPAEGFASIWDKTNGERWYCHGDDEDGPTCYERGSWAQGEARATHDIATGNVMRFDSREELLAWLDEPSIPTGKADQ